MSRLGIESSLMVSHAPSGIRKGQKGKPGTRSVVPHKEKGAAPELERISVKLPTPEAEGLLRWPEDEVGPWRGQTPKGPSTPFATRKGSLFEVGLGTVTGMSQKGMLSGLTVQQNRSKPSGQVGGRKPSLQKGSLLDRSRIQHGKAYSRRSKRGDGPDDLTGAALPSITFTESMEGRKGKNREKDKSSTDLFQGSQDLLASVMAVHAMPGSKPGTPAPGLTPGLDSKPGSALGLRSHAPTPLDDLCRSKPGTAMSGTKPDTAGQFPVLLSRQGTSDLMSLRSELGTRQQERPASILSPKRTRQRRMPEVSEYVNAASQDAPRPSTSEVLNLSKPGTAHSGFRQGFGNNVNKAPPEDKMAAQILEGRRLESRRSNLRVSALHGSSPVHRISNAPIVKDASRGTASELVTEIPQEGLPGYKLERTVMGRMLQKCDMGNFPAQSLLLQMIEKGIISEEGIRMIAKQVPHHSTVEELKNAILYKKQPMAHCYEDMVTDKKGNTVVGKEDQPKYQILNFQPRADAGDGPLGVFSRADMIHLNSIFLPYLGADGLGNPFEPDDDDFDFGEYVQEGLDAPSESPTTRTLDLNDGPFLEMDDDDSNHGLEFARPGSRMEAMSRLLSTRERTKSPRASTSKLSKTEDASSSTLRLAYFLERPQRIQ